MLTEGKVPAGSFRADRVLVIQLGDIGDVVLTTPALRALKETYPGARIDALVRKGYGCLLEADPHLSGVVEVSKARGKLLEIGRENLGLVRRLRGGRYDLVIDLRTGDRGAILALLAGAPARVSRHWREGPFWRRLAFNRLVVDPPPAPPPVHPGADQSLRIVRALGADTSDTAPRLHVPREALGRARSLLAAEGIGEGERFVTINPFSRWKYKEWGYDRWPEVVGRLREKHRLPALVVGSGDEAEKAAGIGRPRPQRRRENDPGGAGRAALPERPPPRGRQRRASHRRGRRYADGHDLRAVELESLDGGGRDAPGRPRRHGLRPVRPEGVRGHGTEPVPRRARGGRRRRGRGRGPLRGGEDGRPLGSADPPPPRRGTGPRKERPGQRRARKENLPNLSFV
jgi:ADP-heptose:LPS heptosyltransferase